MCVFVRHTCNLCTCHVFRCFSDQRQKAKNAAHWVNALENALNTDMTFGLCVFIRWYSACDQEGQTSPNSAHLITPLWATDEMIYNIYNTELSTLYPPLRSNQIPWDKSNLYIVNFVNLCVDINCILSLCLYKFPTGVRKCSLL